MAPLSNSAPPYHPPCYNGLPLVTSLIIVTRPIIYVIDCLFPPLLQVGRFDINYPKVSGHKSGVLDIAWNPFNENEIASCSEDCNVMIWNITDDMLTRDVHADSAVRTLSGHQKKVC